MSERVRVKQLAFRVMTWPTVSKAALVAEPANSLFLAVKMTGYPARRTAILAPALSLHVPATVTIHLIASFAGMLHATQRF